MINNGFDHFKYSVYIRFIRNTANPYSVYKKPNPNTANPYSVYKKTNPNSFISYSVYKKRNYSVPYIFGFGRIIRIWLTPIFSIKQDGMAVGIHNIAKLQWYLSNVFGFIDLIVRKLMHC